MIRRWSSTGRASKASKAKNKSILLAPPSWDHVWLSLQPPRVATRSKYFGAKPQVSAAPHAARCIPSWHSVEYCNRANSGATQTTVQYDSIIVVVCYRLTNFIKVARVQHGQQIINHRLRPSIKACCVCNAGVRSTKPTS